MPSRSASPTRARSKSRMAASRSSIDAARPEPQVRGDLVVARAAGVEAAGERPDPCRPGPPRRSCGCPRATGPTATRPLPRPRRRGPAGRRRGSRPRRRSGCPARPRPRTWAIEPAMSSAARAASISIERVKSATRCVRLAAEPPAPGPHRASDREALMLPGGPAADGRRGRARPDVTAHRAAVGPACRTSRPTAATCSGQRQAVPRHAADWHHGDARDGARRRRASAAGRRGGRRPGPPTRPPSRVHRPQPPGGVLGGQVALGLGQQLVADHELADVGPQERRVEMGVDLPVVGRRRRRTAPGASPSNTGTAA